MAFKTDKMRVAAFCRLPFADSHQTYYDFNTPHQYVTAVRLELYTIGITVYIDRLRPPTPLADLFRILICSRVVRYNRPLHSSPQCRQSIQSMHLASVKIRMSGSITDRRAGI